MASTKTLPLDELPGAFEQARGNADDKAWARLVISRFFFDNVNSDLMTKELGGVLELVRQTGDNPQQLYGAASDYVDGQVRLWRADDVPFEQTRTTTGWREVPVLSSVLSAFLAVLLLVLEVIAGNSITSFTLGKVLTPLLAGTAVIIAMTAFDSLVIRIRRLGAFLVSSAIVVVAMVTIGLLFAAGNDEPLFFGSAWWYVVLIALHAVIALIASLFRPRSQRREKSAVPMPDDSFPSWKFTVDLTETPEPAPDHEWVRQFAAALRLRGMQEAQVQSAISEARQLAMTRGITLREEFGPPGEYASRVPRSTTAKRTRELWRRVAWLMTIPAFGYFAFEGLQHGLEWDNVQWLMAIPFAVACVRVVGFIGKPMPAKT